MFFNNTPGMSFHTSWFPSHVMFYCPLQKSENHFDRDKHISRIIRELFEKSPLDEKRILNFLAGHKDCFNFGINHFNIIHLSRFMRFFANFLEQKQSVSIIQDVNINRKIFDSLLIHFNNLVIIHQYRKENLFIIPQFPSCPMDTLCDLTHALIRIYCCIEGKDTKIPYAIHTYLRFLSDSVIHFLKKNQVLKYAILPVTKFRLIESFLCWKACEEMNEYDLRLMSKPDNPPRNILYFSSSSGGVTYEYYCETEQVWQKHTVSFQELGQKHGITVSHDGSITQEWLNINKKSILNYTSDQGHTQMNSGLFEFLNGLLIDLDINTGDFNGIFDLNLDRIKNILVSFKIHPSFNDFYQLRTFCAEIESHASQYEPKSSLNENETVREEQFGQTRADDLDYCGHISPTLLQKEQERKEGKKDKREKTVFQEPLNASVLTQAAYTSTATDEMKEKKLSSFSSTSRDGKGNGRNENQTGREGQFGQTRADGVSLIPLALPQKEQKHKENKPVFPRPFRRNHPQPYRDGQYHGMTVEQFLTQGLVLRQDKKLGLETGKATLHQRPPIHQTLKLRVDKALGKQAQVSVSKSVHPSIANETRQQEPKTKQKPLEIGKSTKYRAGQWTAIDDASKSQAHRLEQKCLAGVGGSSGTNQQHPTRTPVEQKARREKNVYKKKAAKRYPASKPTELKSHGKQRTWHWQKREHQARAVRFCEDFPVQKPDQSGLGDFLTNFGRVSDAKLFTPSLVSDLCSEPDAPGPQAGIQSEKANLKKSETHLARKQPQPATDNTAKLVSPTACEGLPLEKKEAAKEKTNSVIVLPCDAERSDLLLEEKGESKQIEKSQSSEHKISRTQRNRGRQKEEATKAKILEKKQDKEAKAPEKQHAKTAEQGGKSKEESETHQSKPVYSLIADEARQKMSESLADGGGQSVTNQPHPVSKPVEQKDKREQRQKREAPTSKRNKNIQRRKKKKEQGARAKKESLGESTTPQSKQPPATDDAARSQAYQSGQKHHSLGFKQETKEDKQMPGVLSFCADLMINGESRRARDTRVAMRVALRAVRESKYEVASKFLTVERLLGHSSKKKNADQIFRLPYWVKSLSDLPKFFRIENEKSGVEAIYAKIELAKYYLLFRRNFIKAKRLADKAYKACFEKGMNQNESILITALSLADIYEALRTTYRREINVSNQSDFYKCCSQKLKKVYKTVMAAGGNLFIEIDNSEFWVELGNCLLKQGQFKEAFICFLKAAANKDPEAIFQLAQLLKPDQANDQMEKIAQQLEIKAIEQLGDVRNPREGLFFRLLFNATHVTPLSHPRAAFELGKYMLKNNLSSREFEHASGMHLLNDLRLMSKKPDDPPKNALYFSSSQNNVTYEYYCETEQKWKKHTVSFQTLSEHKITAPCGDRITQAWLDANKESILKYTSNQGHTQNNLSSYGLEYAARYIFTASNAGNFSSIEASNLFGICLFKKIGGAADLLEQIGPDFDGVIAPHIFEMLKNPARYFLIANQIIIPCESSEPKESNLYTNISLSQVSPGSCKAATYNYGRCHEAGKGVKKDAGMAYNCYNSSSEANDHPVPLYQLGLCHLQGKGVPQDFEFAISYFKRAVSNGIVDFFNKTPIQHNLEGWLEPDYPSQVVKLCKSLYFGECGDNSFLKKETKEAVDFWYKGTSMSSMQSMIACMFCMQLRVTYRSSFGANSISFWRSVSPALTLERLQFLFNFLRLILPHDGLCCTTQKMNNFANKSAMVIKLGTEL